MYTLHLQQPAVTLHPSGLHGRIITSHVPSSSRPPHRRHSPPSPLPAPAPTPAAGSRFAYVLRASAVENPRPDPQVASPRSRFAYVLRASAAENPRLDPQVAIPRSRFAYVLRASAAENPRPDPQDEPRPKVGFWTKWMVDGSEARARVTKLGLAAVLAYGLFDAVTYTTFFVLAFLGYEKSTGKNPAANLKALLGIVILMWTGNNVTRPFRVAGAAALAPVIDRGLKVIQEKLNLPSQMYAFALVVGSVAAICFTVVGILILSKWGK